MQEQSNQNIHANHRRRVCDSFLKGGIKSMADHNIIEMLLFYSCPRKDTNATAHALMKYFGSFVNILEAEHDELLKVDGIGEASATFINFISQLSQKYYEDKASNGIALNTAVQIKEYLQAKFMNSQKEDFCILMFDNRGKLLNTVTFEGYSPDSVNIENRVVAETVLRCNTSYVIVAHNHPNGFAAPSPADVAATKQLKELLENINISLYNHFIVSPEGIFSMADTEKFADIFI